MIDAVSFRARIGYFNLRIKARVFPLKNITKNIEYGPTLLFIYIGILSVATLCTGLSYSVGPSKHYSPNFKSGRNNCIESSSTKLESNYYSIKKSV